MKESCQKKSHSRTVPIHQAINQLHFHLVQEYLLVKIWNLKIILNLIHFGLIHLRIYKIFHILTSALGENLQISLSVSQSQKQVIQKFLFHDILLKHLLDPVSVKLFGERLLEKVSVEALDKEKIGGIEEQLNFWIIWIQQHNYGNNHQQNRPPFYNNFHFNYNYNNFHVNFYNYKSRMPRIIQK